MTEDARGEVESAFAGSSITPEDQNPYSAEFYEGQSARSRASAQEILPIVFDLIGPRSTVDVGCGVGTWLEVAQELGATQTVGIEGTWIKSSGFEAKVEIRSQNLESPVREPESFDLAISMEVAEHLSPERAESFVEDLCDLAPHVLFSAAIPGQGGTNHVNERWQSYWTCLFAARGFGVRDVIRPKVWFNLGVEYWYAQNALLFSRGHPINQTARVDRVHPFHILSPKRILNDWLGRAR